MDDNRMGILGMYGYGYLLYKTQRSLEEREDGRERAMIQRKDQHKKKDKINNFESRPRDSRDTGA